jgi:hypothetical protein
MQHTKPDPVRAVRVRSSMKNHLSWIILAVALVVPAPLIACDATTPCDKCAKDAEMSWNPENKFATDRLKRFYALDDHIKKAYAASDFAGAGKLATEYLELANTYRCNWNYGNAVHDANRYLGLISLKKGDTDAAIVYLREAGKSTGSPQLDTFGPELDLANALLKGGRTEAVQVYLKDVKKFWKMDNGQVAGWLAAIDAGETPELDRFATQRSGIYRLVILWSPVVWPVPLVGATLYLLRSRIAKKWLFVFSGLLAAYLTMFVTNVGIGFLFAFLMDAMANSGPTAISIVLYASLAARILFPTLAVAGVARYFARKNEPDLVT